MSYKINRKLTLTKRWDEGDPRPCAKLPWWQCRLMREGWRFWWINRRPVTDAEFRQVIEEWRSRPPEHFNCRCRMEEL